MPYSDILNIVIVIVWLFHQHPREKHYGMIIRMVKQGCSMIEMVCKK